MHTPSIAPQGLSSPFFRIFSGSSLRQGCRAMIVGPNDRENNWSDSAAMNDQRYDGDMTDLSLTRV